MQIQATFDGLGLADLRLMGVGIYLRIPNFKKDCPLCRGANCAVRHGLYHRCVVDADGSLIERFPIPRFRCRRRGPLRAKAVTFSVLPAALVPRRRFSLALMLLIVHLVGRRPSIPQVLDDLAERERGTLVVEETTVYRLLSLFARVYLGLDREAAGVIGVRPDPGDTRGRALALAEALLVEEAVRHPRPLLPSCDFTGDSFPGCSTTSTFVTL